MDRLFQEKNKMEDDLEEGEISDSDEETAEITASSEAGSSMAPNDYTLLSRPTNPAMSYRAPQDSPGLPPAQSFRSSPSCLAAQDSDADSDDSREAAKRPKLLPNVSTKAPRGKKSNLWADVLFEQQISSKIVSGGITSDDIDTVERGVESYRPAGESRTVTREDFEDGQEAATGELWDVNDDGEVHHTVRKKKDKKKKRKIKDRLDLEYESHGFDSHDDHPLEVCANDDERDIARYIARNLNEPKVVLLERVTRFVGREKTLELFNATMDIEAAGGMKTLRGDTRRTPGGVFLQLLKKDKGISKETIQDIFAIERENQKFVKKVIIKEKQARKRKYYSKENSDTMSEGVMSSTSRNDNIDDLDLMDEPDIQLGVPT
ncbi:phosphorylated adapter RNA export protein-like [Watersipora subatra]|uniref:phosphorylated adapter RNA export protein-like n=1 Tax=Watersipora subatra TaxID=2589382 RepID=UPI00355C568A